jgi:hypothetical protein
MNSAVIGISAKDAGRDQVAPGEPGGQRVVVDLGLQPAAGGGRFPPACDSAAAAAAAADPMLLATALQATVPTIARWLLLTQL